jgi:copper chaperone NosL
MKKLMIALVLVIAALALVVRGGTRVPDEVQPIAWNAEPCAHCRMLIGDPAYAAQIITDEGTVYSFDDPGCAVRFMRAKRPRVQRAWFHAGRGDRWIPLEEVGCVKVAASPMGSNVIAVPRTPPGAVGLEELP